jgi:hypothetical protein
VPARAQAKALIAAYVAGDFREPQDNLPHGTKWNPKHYNNTWLPGWND